VFRQALEFFDQWDYLNNCEMRNTFQMETRNMLEAGRLIAQAALMRMESRGGHYRMDYPESKEIWRKHIIFKR